MTRPSVPPPTDDRRCTATTRSGERCTQYAIRGGTVCRMHGGGSPKVRRAAARRVALADAEVVVRRSVAARGPLTLPDVYQALLDTAGTVVGWRDLLTERLDELGGQLTYQDSVGNERVKADVLLFQKALDQATRTLELIARLDIDSRATALSTRQGDAIADVIEQTLAALHLTPEQEAAAPPLLHRALLALTRDQL